MKETSEQHVIILLKKNIKETKRTSGQHIIIYKKHTK